MITFFGLVGDAICVLGGLNLEPAFFSYLFCALPIVILEFNYLAGKTTIKNAGILALSLGLLANPILGITVLKSLSVQFQVNIAMVLFGLLIAILAAAVLYHLWKKEKQPEKSKQALLWLTIALIVFVLSAIFLLFTSAG